MTKTTFIMIHGSQISSRSLFYKPLHWKVKNKAKSRINLEIVISIINLHYHINSIILNHIKNRLINFTNVHIKKRKNRKIWQEWLITSFLLSLLENLFSIINIRAGNRPDPISNRRYCFLGVWKNANVGWSHVNDL